MRFTFLGHAAFLLETVQTRLITDPYSSVIGYDPINLPTDIVTLSHDNPKWHSCIEELVGSFESYRGLENLHESRQLGDVTLEAIEVFEVLPDDGPNAMVKITDSQGLRVLHTGDCGHLPTPEQIVACGEVDVLLALAGGFPTMALDDLMAFIEALKPKVVIPMHYAVPHLTMNALPVGALAEKWASENVVWHEGTTLEITPEKLASSAELHILKPLRVKA